MRKLHVAIFISNKKKMSFFCFVFFYKIAEQEGRTGPAQGEKLVPVEGGRW
jgi:hypothetical protein